MNCARRCGSNFGRFSGISAAEFEIWGSETAARARILARFDRQSPMVAT
jgi:hypothetical protein